MFCYLRLNSNSMKVVPREKAPQGHLRYCFQFQVVPPHRRLDKLGCFHRRAARVVKGITTTLYKELLADWDVVTSPFSVVKSLKSPYFRFLANVLGFHSINP